MNQTCCPCHWLPGPGWHSYWSSNAITRPLCVAGEASCGSPCSLPQKCYDSSHTQYLFYFISPYSASAKSLLARHLSIVCWDCTTLCDFLCFLLYSPHCWRLTMQWNFIRSPWPSCLQSQGKEMHHPASLRDLVYLHLSVWVLNLSLKMTETNSNTTSKKMINPFCKNYHLRSAEK